ncbi:MAG TPA: DUF4157 domain-containing protein [Pyrinomonadaceae bacterium]|jgi:hypothetical protein
MQLAPEAHARLERFLRVSLRDEGLRLPAVAVHTGRVAGALTRVLRVGAITFGRHVFLAPAWCARGADGAVRVPGWLVAHEAVHVVQYRRAGAARFLCAYLGEYARQVWRGPGRPGARHARAYRAIRFEAEAFAVETAYREQAARFEALTLR